MNQAAARRYLACSKGNAFVAAWIAILDEHKLPLGTPIPPEEWYQAFEEMYLNDAIDPDVFNMCDVQKVFSLDNKLRPRDLEDAFWNLRYLKNLHPGEAADNEDFVMDKRNNVPAPDLNDIIDGPAQHPHALTRVLSEPDMRLDRPMRRAGELSMPDLPALGESVIDRPPVSHGSMIERQSALDTPRALSTTPQPVSDIRGLACHSNEPRRFERPYTEAANFQVMCCGEEIYLEDTGCGDWFEGEESEDHDTVDFQLHGTCPRCNTVIHMGASMPIPKGAMGGMY